MLSYPETGQPTPLLIKHLLNRTLTWAPDQVIVYRDLCQFTYREFFGRLQRLAGALIALGIKPGDRVGVMDHDSHRYLELFFAVPMIGAVLHTINVRLTLEQTVYTIDHAEDVIVLAHTDFLPLVRSIAPSTPRVRAWIWLADEPLPDVAVHPEFQAEYESLLARAPATFRFPDFDENTIATLFYTTGTTGEPKGVYFTHRQLVLHTLNAGWTLAAHTHPGCLRTDDVYMPLTPMFHVHGWGVPYAATALGIKQVYAGRYEPALLLRLLAQHKVTFSHCVPTILQLLLHHPTARQTNLQGLKIMIGGAALSKGLTREASTHGIKLVGGYGLSETCPIIAVSQVKEQTVDGDPETIVDYVTRSGFPILFVEARALNLNGEPLPPGPENIGELGLRAPWLTRGYYKQPEQSANLWRDGWLHTGDIAYIDQEGYIRITDRLKDVIKIGGEWISSLEIENALSQHPAVKEVAVVGIPNKKWDECPHAEIVLHPLHEETVTPKLLKEFLHTFIDRGVIHKRAILTEIRITASIPRTSVGKLDKKQIRASLATPPVS